MIDYTTLKHSSDGMPTWDAYLGILLKLAMNKQLWTADAIKTAAVDELNLPDELRNREYNSKSTGNVAKNRAGFALSDLKIAGYLRSPRRGEYEITRLGKDAWKKYGLNLSRTVVHDEPLHKQHQAKLAKIKSDNSDTSETLVSFNEDLIQDWFNPKNHSVSLDVLATNLAMALSAFFLFILLSHFHYVLSSIPTRESSSSSHRGENGTLYRCCTVNVPGFSLLALSVLPFLPE